MNFNAEVNRIDEEYKDRSDLLAYIDTLDLIVLRDHYHRVEIEAKVDWLSKSLDKEKILHKSISKTLAIHNLQFNKFKKKTKEQYELLSSLKNSLTDRETEVEALKLALVDREAEVES